MKAVIIHTYAGSLLLAARSAGLPVVASLEADGYGTAIQRDNFPGLDCRASVREWPDADLSSAIVAAHPPCSPFSVASCTRDGSASRGLGSDAFGDTRRVLDYALSKRAAALLVESVVGALEGAAAVHQAAADRYGYRLYRVLVDAAACGVPQRRPRFWAVFARPDLRVAFAAPRAARPTVGDALAPFRGLDPPAERNPQHPKDTWTRTLAALDAAGAREVVSGSRGFGKLYRLAGRPLAEFGSWDSSAWTVLDPGGLAPTLTRSSQWVVDGAPLATNDYKTLMGFPRDYRLPETARGARGWLSKGVCPPVGAWLLEQAAAWLRGDAAGQAVAPGDVYDARRS